MEQDGPEAQTWADFEEDCDAVNQARAFKINDGGYGAYQLVSAETFHRWKMPLWNAEGAIWRSLVGNKQEN